MRSIALGPTRAAIALIACALVGAAVLSAEASAQTKKLRIAYTQTPTNVPIIVAKEQGFYQKYGLDVTLTPQTSSQQAQISLGKQYDITNATVANLVGMPVGFDPVLVVGQDYTEKNKFSGTSVMVPKGINSYKQLKGKTIGIVAIGSGIQYVGFRAAMDKAGVKPNEYKLQAVPFPSMLDALRAGVIDAAVGVGAFVDQMKAAGYGPLANPLFAVAKRVPGTIWMSKRSVIKKDPAKFRAFRKAFIETLRWMKTHDAEWKASVARNFGVTQAVANRTVIFPWILTDVSPKLIVPWAKPMYRLGLIKKKQYKAVGNGKQLVFKP